MFFTETMFSTGPTPGLTSHTDSNSKFGIVLKKRRVSLVPFSFSIAASLYFQSGRNDVFPDRTISGSGIKENSLIQSHPFFLFLISQIAGRLLIIVIAIYVSSVSRLHSGRVTCFEQMPFVDNQYSLHRKSTNTMIFQKVFLLS